MKKSFVLTLALLVNVWAYAYEPLWQTLNKNFDVKGGVGIEQFVKSLGIIDANELEPENFDKKNGYFEFSEEGDGMFSVAACYWNRTDGKKLFVVRYLCNETYTKEQFDDIVSDWGFCSVSPMEDDFNRIHDTGCMAYLYDEARRQLVPMKTPPFKGLNLNCRTHYRLDLPKQGKDITVYEEITEMTRLVHTLKWNGTSFDFVKTQTSLLEVYCTDKSGEATNIRNAPNGKVIDRLKAGNDYTMYIDKVQNGWCRIYGGWVSDATGEEDDRQLEGDEGGWWIHNSVVGASGIGNGGVTLHESPNAKSRIVFRSNDYTLIHPVEIRCEWVKVIVDGTKEQGWMLKKDICSNPLTTCC